MKVKKEGSRIIVKEEVLNRCQKEALLQDTPGGRKFSIKVSGTRY